MTPTREQFQKITLPILTITGQYDVDELGALTFYRDHIANAPPEARAKHFLIIGPWDHAGTRTPTDEVAGVKFGPGAILDLNDLHRQWYDWTMKAGSKPAFLKNQVAYYLLAPGNSGSNGEWKYADEFAALIANPKTFYFVSKGGDANGVFRSGALIENRPSDGADKFTYDPLDTHRGEFVEGIEPKEKTAGINQTFALSIRDDGLVYHTDPLPNETPLIVPRSRCGYRSTRRMSILNVIFTKSSRMERVSRCGLTSVGCATASRCGNPSSFSRTRLLGATSTPDCSSRGD
jgi:uncharacterized protein